MPSPKVPSPKKLVAEIAAAFGEDAVCTDAEKCAFFSQDMMTVGRQAFAVVSPDSSSTMAKLVSLARKHGIALHMRGGGMSYSQAFAPEQDAAIIVDFSRLSSIREISVQDSFVIVETGCTWAALAEALKPHGVRARFWGPMSGGTATIGGSLSNGSVTFGSGNVGASANAVKSFEIVTGTGAILRTGSDRIEGAAPTNRSFGPDLTGIFGHDCGALGIKTAAVLEIEPIPQLTNGLSFAVDSFEALCRLAAFASDRRLASEVIAMDAEVARQNAGPPNLIEDIKAMWRIGMAAGGPLSALSRMIRIALGGRRFLDRAKYTLHFVIEGRDAKDIASKMRAIKSAAQGCDEIVNTVPLMTRAHPFPELPVTHPDGRRMLPIHGFLPWSKQAEFHEEYQRLKDQYADEMKNHQVTVAEFFATVAGIGMLYEPVFYWPDEIGLFHEKRTPDAMRSALTEHPPNPAGRALVEKLVDEVIELMDRHGATHFQIGRLYPFASRHDENSAKLLKQMKNWFDPDNILNPGVLEL